LGRFRSDRPFITTNTRTHVPRREMGLKVLQARRVGKLPCPP
jgi:hypothetical protein